MPMNDVVTTLIYTEHGNGATTKHAKAPPSLISIPTIIAVGQAAVIATSAAASGKNMTNSSKADAIGGATAAAAVAAAQLGSMLAPSSSGLAALQGQKWQQVFDLDKMIKQLRAAEKTHLRGGGARSANATGTGATDSKQAHVVQVQRLNAADMAYYDIVPKQATRDIVVCNACSGSYTKAGFNNHIALQHPSIWDAIPNKLNGTEITHQPRSNTAVTAIVAENSQDGVREPTELLGSPTETLSATMSSCSNGSSSSIAAVNNNNNNVHGSSSSTSSASSSRHKSSSSKSSSSSKTSSSSTGRSRSKSSKNRHHSELHHKVGGGGSGSKKSSAIGTIVTTAGAPTVVSVKDEASTTAGPPITVFSSSSNSSCSLPPTPTLSAISSNGNGLEHGIIYSTTAQISNLLDEPQLSKKKIKGSTTLSSVESSHHRSKPPKEKQLTPLYEQQQQQQLSELDQAVSSITGHVEMNPQSEQQQPQRQHQVDLSGVTEEPLPMHNTSDDNSISLTLDDMLDSKFINEILNNVESDIPFDESALDTSQSQSQSQQQLTTDQHVAPVTKRLRFDDSGIINADAGDYATTLYQQQQQQQTQVQQQVYSEEHNPEQTQLTAIDAMQLQQLIYQQQQMLEQADHQQQEHHQQQIKQELSDDVVAQFSVYNVPSLTDDADAEVTTAAPTATDEHMILPSIIYEITDNNQVSVLDQQSQQQVIAEFLTQAGYDNVDVNVNVLQAAATTATNNTNGDVANHFSDELCDFDFTKLETVNAEANHTKTVKLEIQPQHQPQPLQATTYNSYENVYQAQPHRQLANAKYHEDTTYFNMTLYAGAPRPLAMNTFGLVKLPNGMGATLRKNLLMTRKANNSLLSLNGSSGVVGTLARPPPPPPTVNCNGNASTHQLMMLPRNAAHNKTIYAQKSSVVAHERFRCNKRALLSRLGSNSNGVGITVKRLNELLAGKLKFITEKEKSEKEKSEKEKEKSDKPEHNEANEQQPQQLQPEQDDHKRMHIFYEKRRKLLMSHNKRQFSIGNNKPTFMRQRPMHLPLQLHGSGINAIGSSSPQLLKKQLLRTLSDSSNILTGSSGVAGGNSNAGNSNPWKSNSSTPGSNSASSDLMRVFV